ncbi:MAG: class I adenylate-forming enzyme family protein [Hyphomonadaceae bacterium]
MNVALLLEMAAEAFPDRIAFGGRSDGVSFSALLARARAGAAWLARQPGRTTVFLGLNGEAVPTALFASALAGRAFAPLNYRLPDADLRKLAARTAPSVLIADDDMIARLGEIEGVALVSRSAFEAACARGGEPVQADVDEADIAILLFTSGTTGEPKAAVLRHEKLFSYVIGSVDLGGAEDGEAALVSVPPYHIAGMSAILTGVYAARRTVYLSAFTPEQWSDAAAREEITQAMVVPTMLDRILDDLERKGERLPRLASLSYGGGRMPRMTIERALNWLPHVGFVNAYGLTETSSTIAILGPDDHRAALTARDDAERRRLSSVGKPLPSVDLEVRDADGRVVAAGEAGEIFVRGPQVAGEYLHKNALSDDGWFGTNDAGWIDEEGYLFVEGRLDDVIVRGGENISPGEIEDVLRQHPHVADVAVIGLPDDKWGERIAAVIAPAAVAGEATELADWVRSRLKSTKTPETWDFRDALPYNETGKLLRRVLRDELTRSAGA